MNDMDKKEILLSLLIVTILVAAIGIFTLAVRYYSRKNIEIIGATEGASVAIPEAKEMTTPVLADDKADDSLFKNREISSFADDEADDFAKPEAEKLVMTIVLSDYDYTYYGILRNVHTLLGDNNVAVGSFEPVGHYVDDLDWETVFISPKALETLGKPHSTDEKGVSWWNSDWKTPHYYKLKMKNFADGGGYIELPSCVVELEEIALNDIPTWGGA